ncbi:Uncharacterised protein [Mycobacteroides abscessus subsp. abscessus]|nr:Uncharacterised protein [Mycobacteroides abscessus subsp. abscessus]
MPACRSSLARSRAPVNRGKPGTRKMLAAMKPATIRGVFSRLKPWVNQEAAR